MVDEDAEIFTGRDQDGQGQERGQRGQVETEQGLNVKVLVKTKHQNRTEQH